MFYTEGFPHGIDDVSQAALEAEPGLSAELARLAALHDQESMACEQIGRLRQELPVPDTAAILEYALAVLYNGLARYQEALAAAQRSSERHPAGGFGLGLAELVEAAARCRQPGVAQAALDALCVRTRLDGTDWGLGVEAYSRALLADGKVAEDLYAEAIERLGRTRARLSLARAHLVYGEWLRRERRRGDAHDHLRTARDLFGAMGARSFAGRARHQLSATGATAHSRRNATLDELTPQETRIASLASDGLSNAEIAGRLYISASTIEYHLGKVLRKLSIRSRAQLHRTLTAMNAG